MSVNLVSGEFLSGLVIGVLACIAFPRMVPQMVKDRIAGWFGKSPYKTGTPVDLEGGKTGVVCDPIGPGVPASCPYRTLAGKRNESGVSSQDGG